MILECPSCGTYYDIPVVIPPEGRKVRCAKCAYTWLALPSPSERDEAASASEPSEASSGAELAGQAAAEADGVGDVTAGHEPLQDGAQAELSGEQQVEIEAGAGEGAPEAAEAESPPPAADLAEIGEAPAEITAETVPSDAGGEPRQAENTPPLSVDQALQTGEHQSELESAEPISENGGLAAESIDAARQSEDAASVRTDQTIEPAAEATVPEADFPIGDFSHRGRGPARSPMQEILSAAAEVQSVGSASIGNGSDRPGFEEPSQGEGSAVSEGEGMDRGVTVRAVEPPEAMVSEPDEPVPGSPAGAAASGAESEWQPPPEQAGAGEIGSSDQPAAEAPVARSGQDVEPTTAQLVSWAALALLVVTGVTLAVVNREAIVRSLPGSASIYSGIGLAVNTRGLDFENVTSSWTTEADQPVLEVKGEIVNVTDGVIAVPSVVFALQDENGVEVHQWEAKVTEQPLEAGARTRFTARIPSPPTSSRSVHVKFAEAR